MRSKTQKDTDLHSKDEKMLDDIQRSEEKEYREYDR